MNNRAVIFICLGLLLIASSCQFRSTATFAPLEGVGDMTFAELTADIRQYRQAQTHQRKGRLRRITADSIDVLTGSGLRKGKPGKWETTWKGDQLIYAMMNGHGTFPGMGFQYRNTGRLGFIIPVSGWMEKTRDGGWLTMMDNHSYMWGFILPTPNDSLHLLVRSLKPPHYDDFDSITARDISSVHLLGDDLETRIKMRFERGKEYFIATVRIDADSSRAEQWIFKRVPYTAGIDLADVTVDSLKSILYTAWKRYQTPPNWAIHFYNIRHRRYFWVEGHYPGEPHDVNYFMGRHCYDMLKPYKFDGWEEGELIIEEPPED